VKRNLWPYAIISYFIIFITGIVTWVSFAMRHEDQLVRPDYYEHEMKYQGQIDRVARTDRSTAAITYDRASQSLHLQLPEPNLQGRPTSTSPLSNQASGKSASTGPTPTANIISKNRSSSMEFGGSTPLWIAE
jgi:hypothetical protein